MNKYTIYDLIETLELNPNSVDIIEALKCICEAVEGKQDQENSVF